MRLLFAKHSLVWPRSSGHDVHTYYMMKACADQGHEVSLATVTEPLGRALDGLPLAARFRLDDAALDDGAPIPATRLQNRFRNYWGVPDGHVRALRAAARQVRAEAVVVVGLDALPFFPAIDGPVRVWYAADEWVLHHVSQLRPGSRHFREDFRAALVKGLYERAHRRVIDRVWVVSDADRAAIRWIAGVPNADVLPNGVDGEFYRPGTEQPEPRTAVFWGRLDFGPNIQALDWFCGKVWPAVRGRVPDARFTVIGFQPTDAVREIVNQPGITLEANLPDLRAAVRRHAVTVLPFVSGAGIKNKLLEAAALGLPIVGTSKAARGLRGASPVVTADAPAAFADALVSLWTDADRQRELGRAGRAWVLEHHTWASVAREAVARMQPVATSAAAGARSDA
ncbi:MAG: glycosyltransferase family 4 protein [Vicinamibacterales bacterium]